MYVSFSACKRRKTAVSSMPNEGLAKIWRDPHCFFYTTQNGLQRAARYPALSTRCALFGISLRFIKYPIAPCSVFRCGMILYRMRWNGISVANNFVIGVDIINILSEIKVNTAIIYSFLHCLSIKKHHFTNRMFALIYFTNIYISFKVARCVKKIGCGCFCAPRKSEMYG